MLILIKVVNLTQLALEMEKDVREKHQKKNLMLILRMTSNKLT
jgi:hypothetical protein